MNVVWHKINPYQIKLVATIPIILMVYSFRDSDASPNTYHIHPLKYISQ